MKKTVYIAFVYYKGMITHKRHVSKKIHSKCKRIAARKAREFVNRGNSVPYLSGVFSFKIKRFNTMGVKQNETNNI